MSPTVLRVGPYRFFFFSREEKRMHVHVMCGDGEAKYWIDPIVALADSTGLKPKQLTEIQKIVEEKRDEIEKGWKKHFPG